MANGNNPGAADGGSSPSPSPTPEPPTQPPPGSLPGDPSTRWPPKLGFWESVAWALVGGVIAVVVILTWFTFAAGTPQWQKDQLNCLGKCRTIEVEKGDNSPEAQACIDACFAQAKKDREQERRKQ